MADLAAARPADRPDLADGEGGHVVVEHELLAVLVHDAVDPLLVGAGAEDGGDQGLGLAALEERRAVRAGQQADLALDRPQVLGAAAVGPLAVEDQLADDPLLDRGEGGLDPCRRGFDVGRHRAGSGIAGGTLSAAWDAVEPGAPRLRSAGTSSLMIVFKSALVAALRSAFMTICLVSRNCSPYRS